MPQSPLIHFELAVNDPEKARAFYTQVLGWSITPTSMPHYQRIDPGREPEGGLMQKPPQAPHAAMTVYFYVDDVAATLAAAVAAGGKVVLPPLDIPNVGTAGIFADPDGIAVGVFHPLVC